MDEQTVVQVSGEAASETKKKPYDKPQLHSLCVAGGTSKSTQNPTEASVQTGPS